MSDQQQDITTSKLIICSSSTDPKGNFYGESEFKDEWIYLNLGGILSLKCPSSVEGEVDQEYKLKLNTIEYDKKVFSPCQMTLSFSVTKPLHPSATLGPLLKSEYLSMECELFVPGKKKNESDTLYPKLYIAQSYFIHSFQINDLGCSMTCVFKCYSMDRKIAVKKGCEAFSFKRFGSDIFAAQPGAAGVMDGKVQFDCNRLLMMGYNSSSKACRDGNHNEELVHPYLVRYNETLYDFLARVAHRCGEFMYFEGGKLWLGLPDATFKTITGQDGGECRTYSSDEERPLCSFPNISVMDEDVNADGFAVNYATGQLEVDELKSYFDMQFTSDEHLYNVKESDNLGGVSDWWMFINALSTIFTSEDIINGLVKAAVNAATSAISAEVIIPDILNQDFEKFIKDTPVASEINENLHNAFFYTVNLLEKKSEREKVVMNCSSTYPALVLGAAVSPTEDGKKYVVTRAYGKFSSGSGSSETSHTVEGVPVQSEITIDKLPALAVPPLDNIPHQVTSGPMEAIVEKNDDPLRLGRVRIRYPWQVSGDDAQLSPWIRVPVPFAGSADDSGGCTMTPAPGERVIVDFSGGNVERPYVDGSYYFRSGDTRDDAHSPSKGVFSNDKYFNLPTNKTRAIVSGNGHTLMFKDDDNDNTDFFSQALPGLGTLLSVISAFVPSFDGTVPGLPIKGGGVYLADGSRLCSIELSGSTRSVNIRSNWGTVNMSAFTGITVNAPNGDVVIRGKNVNIKAGNNVTLRAGANIKPKKPKTGDTVANVLGTLAGQLLWGSIAAGTGVDLRGCLDLTVIRCILDIILRPVEGTLTVKSGRNVIFTVGEGKVTIPGSCLSGEDKSPAGKAVNAIRKSCGIIDDYFAEFRSMYDKILNACAEYENIISHNASQIQESFKKDESDFSPKKVKATSAAKKGDRVDSIFPNKTEVVKDTVSLEHDKIYRSLKSSFRGVHIAVKEYLEYVSSSTGDTMKNALDSKFAKLKNKSGNYVVKTEKFPTDYRTPFAGALSDVTLVSDDFIKSPTSNYANRIKVMKRSAIAQIILTAPKPLHFVKQKGGSGPGLLSDYNLQEENPEFLTEVLEVEGNIVGEADNWYKLVNSITTWEKPAQTGTASSGVKSFASGMMSVLGGGGEYSAETGQWTGAPSVKALLNRNGEAGPRRFSSEVSPEGAVLFSNTVARTLLCTNKPEWISFENGDGFGVARLVQDMNLIW